VAGRGGTTAQGGRARRAGGRAGRARAAAAMLALLGGAAGITVPLREDRRHIQDRDVRILRQVLPRGLNLELAASDEILAIAREGRPDEATLVPEERHELTTQGRLHRVAHHAT